MDTFQEKITGFMHIAMMGEWRSVVAEQVDLLIQSGLANRSNAIHLGVLGTQELAIKHPFQILYRSPNLEFYEYETLEHIWNYCKINSGYVWYIHTKGVSKTPEDWEKYAQHYQEVLKVDSFETLVQNEKEWRHYMQYHVVQKYKECIAALEDHDLCGPSWRPFSGKEGEEEFCAHFSGNFWWARNDYVRTLPNPYDFAGTMVGHFGGYRSGAECWIGSGDPRVKCQCDLGVNFYRWGAKKHWYIKNPIFI